MRAREIAGWVGVVLVGAVLSLPATARAQEGDRVKSAADEFDAGRRAFKAGEFEAAAAHFENADRDAPSPEALLSAIKARKEAKQADRAATLAQLGIARYPNEKGLVDAARQVITDSEKSLHKAKIACSPACAVVVDNRVVPGADSASRIVYLEPGPHSLTLTWPGNRHSSDEVVGFAGGTAQLSYTAPPSGSPAKAATEPPAAAAPAVKTPPIKDDGKEIGKDAGTSGSGLPQAVFFTGLGVTAVLAGISIWSGIDTQNNPGQDAYKAACDSATGNATECKNDFDNGHAREVRTNILLGTTAGVAVVTVVLGVLTDWGGGKSGPSLDLPPIQESRRGRIRPLVFAGDGVGIGAVGTF